MERTEPRIEMAEIRLTENERRAAERVLSSGALRQGAECAAFEAEFAAKVGARHARTCANGTAALHLAYLCFLEPGDEVLVPSFTFIATASAVNLAGGRPIFCDVDPKTFLIDLGDAEQRITERTRAIAPVHLFGNACDLDSFHSFARKYDLRVVWDAAQAHGAMIKGRDVGSSGDFVCYSFYPTKNLFIGEGGMICTDSENYAGRINLKRSHGQSGKYYHTEIGMNYRMTDVEAAIGREQLLRLDDMLATRRRNGALLNERLAKVPGIQPQRMTSNSEHAFHQYCITVDDTAFGRSRDELAQHLEANGIASAVHYPRGLHQQPAYEDLYGKQTLAVTERLTERILALPVHHGLQEHDVERIAEAIVSCRA